MATSEDVTFYSHGTALAGTLRLPEDAGANRSVAAVVQGPGWLGLRDAKLYEPYHEALLAAGIAVFVFDYRGFGGSEGDATYLDPMTQVEDWRTAVTYVRTRSEIDPQRIGAFGSGGTGGGNAVYAAGLDDRIKATVSQVPVADGRDWLHRMRREHEWLEFLERIRDRSRSASDDGHGRAGRAARRNHGADARAPDNDHQERRRRTDPGAGRAGQRRGDLRLPAASTWSPGSRRER